MMLKSLLIAAILSAAAFAADQLDSKDAPPATEPEAQQVFQAAYESGAAAAGQGKWLEAQQHLLRAFKLLGKFNSPHKTAAETLLKKADQSLVKEDALVTANELLRLKQWPEAEEAYRKVMGVVGETEALRGSVQACRQGLEEENQDFRKASELLREGRWQKALEAFNGASESLGMVRAIRDGMNTAQLNLEANTLLKKASELLAQRKWDDAFKAYQRVQQILGESDEVKKGIAAAQNGFAEDQKAAAEKALVPVKPPAPPVSEKDHF